MPEVSAMSDDELAKSLLKLKGDYSILYDDPDGFRMGDRYFAVREEQMKADAGEIFNRIASDGLGAHPGLSQLFGQLSRLSNADRSDGEKVYETMCGRYRVSTPDQPSVEERVPAKTEGPHVLTRAEKQQYLKELAQGHKLKL